MTAPTLNNASNLDRESNPILHTVRFLLRNEPEDIATVQPVPGPHEMAQWLRENAFREDILDAVSETWERRDAVARMLPEDREPPPGNTGDMLRTTSGTEWEFIVMPIIRAWLADHTGPERTVPERFVITGWLSEYGEADNSWTLLTPGDDRSLHQVRGTAEALPPLKPGTLYEFHTSRDRENAPHRLWHINTRDLNPENAGIRRIRRSRHSLYRGR